MGLVTMVTLDVLECDDPALTTTTGVPDTVDDCDILGNSLLDPPALIIFIPINK